MFWAGVLLGAGVVLRGAREVDGADAGRVDLPDFEAEGLTYERLMKQNVKHIAHCLASDEVADSGYHATKSHLYKASLYTWACSTVAHLIPHRHYRLVLNVIGCPLNMFRSTCELVLGVRDALIGKLLS